MKLLHTLGCTCATCLALYGLATRAPETCGTSADSVFFECPIAAPEPADFHQEGGAPEPILGTRVVAFVSAAPDVTANLGMRLGLQGNPDPFKPGGKHFKLI